jgi:hypothetical protein
MSIMGALDNKMAFHSIQSSGAIAKIDCQPVVNEADDL